MTAKRYERTAERILSAVPANESANNASESNQSTNNTSESHVSTGNANASNINKGASNMNSVDAYGQLFVLAPTFCLRLVAEDSMLLEAAVQTEGLAIFLQSELSGKPDLTDCFGTSVAPSLSEDARRVWTDDNAGGSSRNSEAMSMEVLSRAFGAILHKTEMQLRYFPSNGSITDMSIFLGGIALGVSVTRALHRPRSRFGPEDAEALLRKKLRGVLAATETCYNANWRKQLLHVWAAGPTIALNLESAYVRLEPELTADTVVLVTWCHGLPELFDEKAQPPVPRARVHKGAKDDLHLKVLQESDPVRANAREERHVGDVRAACTHI